jgi:hypothetical protein
MCEHLKIIASVDGFKEEFRLEYLRSPRLIFGIHKAMAIKVTN